MKFNQSPTNNEVIPSKAVERVETVPSVLPIEKYREFILELIKNNPSVIIVGETGSGKTTRTPIFLMEEFKDKNIAVTSPRVLPARSVSKYVANQIGGEVGKEIGLVTREIKEVSEDTRVTFMTDGILLNMLRRDPMLLDLDIVMVDEAHERSLNIDLGLGLLKQAQRLRKEKGESELKIVVASATIEEQKFADYFNNSPVAKVPGRLFPVDLEYREVVEGDDYTKEAGKIVKETLDQTTEGDILIFMPGEEEINRTVNEINSLGVPYGVEVLPLFGSMNPQDQDKIFAKNGRRKIIVSTNIAETSVTIDGVVYVIDSGLLKQKEYNPETGVDSLSVTKASKANLNQRMGRAGRTAPGKCIRLISQNDFESREDFQKPEIQRFDLGEVVLKMKEMGIKDVEGFDYIDNPSKARLHDAVINLTRLGALDTNGDITETGKEMVRLQLRPDLARMLIEAKHLDCVNEMIDICAMMSSSKQIFIRPRNSNDPSEVAENYRKKRNQDELKIESSDILTLLHVWEKWEEYRFSKSFAFENLLNVKALNEVGLVRMQLLRALGDDGINAENKYEDIDEIKITKCLLAGQPDAIFFSSNNGYTYSPTTDLPYLEGVQIFPGSVLFKRGGSLILAMNISKSEKDVSNGWGSSYKKTSLYARTCHRIDLEKLKAISSNIVREEKIGLPEQMYEGSGFYQRSNIYINNKFIKQDYVLVEDYIEPVKKVNFDEIPYNLPVTDYNPRAYERDQIIESKPADTASLGDLFKKFGKDDLKENASIAREKERTIDSAKVVEKEIMTTEKKNEFVSLVEDMKLMLSNLKVDINNLSENKDKKLKSASYLAKIKEFNSECNSVINNLDKGVLNDVEKVKGKILEIKNSIKSLIKYIHSDKKISDKLFDNFTDNRNKIIEAAKRNEVTVDDILNEKITKIAFDNTVNNQQGMSPEEAENILIGIV